MHFDLLYTLYGCVDVPIRLFVTAVMTGTYIECILLIIPVERYKHCGKSAS